MKKIYFTPNTIVAFHVGRGGRFHNPGHITFEGEHKIGDFIDNLYPPTIETDLGITEDITPDAEWHNECGTLVTLTNEMIATGIGIIDIDGHYNTTYTKHLADIERDSDEWKAIFASTTFYAEQAQRVLRPEIAIETLEELADYINTHEDWDIGIADVIELNGWEDETDQPYGICSDDWTRLSLNEQGKAYTSDIE